MMKDEQDEPKKRFTFDADKYTNFVSDIWKKREDDETSSHWLRGSIFDRSKSFFNDTKKSVITETHDYLALSQYQTAIGNFVRIMTDDPSIKVRFKKADDASNNKDCIKSGVVTLSANIEATGFDAAVGLALHEASHIKHTDIGLYARTDDKMRRELQSKDYTGWQVISSFIEDAYVDAATYNTAPGYRGYYAALYQKYYGNDDIVDGFNSFMHMIPTWESYLFHVVNSRNPLSNPNALPNLKNILDMIDIQNIERLDTQKKRLELADKVSYAIKKLVDDFNQFQQQQQSQQQDDEDDDDSQQQESQSSGSGSGKSSSKSNSNKNKDDEGDSEDSEDSDDQDSDSDNQDNKKNNGSKNDQGDSDDDDEEDDDENENGDGGEGNEDSDEDENESDAEQNENGNGNSDDEDEDDNGQSLRKPNQELLKQIKKFCKQNNLSGGNPNTKNSDKKTASQYSKIEQAIKSQQDFITGVYQADKTTMSDDAQDIIDAYVNADVSDIVVDYTAREGTAPKKVKVLVIKKVNTQFIDTVGQFYGMYTRVDYGTRQSVTEGIRLGKSFAKRIQVRNEERTMVTNRLKSGKLDKRLLHEIGFDNYAVFSKINIHTYKPSFIHISLDQSGSMRGSKWHNAIQFAAMMATASKYINNLHVVISVRTTVHDQRDMCNRSSRENSNTPYIAYIFDSKVDGLSKIESIFPHITAHANTPEGLCFAAITNDIIKMSRNTDAYCINICDGEPYYSYQGGNSWESNFDYQGAAARRHSGAQMQKMQNHGISCMTYFIGDDASTYAKVRECYGKHSDQIKSPNDIRIIASSINELLLKDTE